jgi:hypothetical protein
MARPSAAGSSSAGGKPQASRLGSSLRPDSRTAALITAITGGSAGRNLGILMRLLIGAGTPRGAAARARACLFLVYTGQAVAIILVAASRDGLPSWLRSLPLTPRLIRTGLQQRAAKADARYASPWYADSARSGRWPERRAARVRRCGCRSFRARRSCRGRWSTAAPR